MNTSARLDPFAVSLVVASLAAWFWAVRRWRSGGRLVLSARRSPVPWGLMDVLVTVLLLAALQQAAGSAVQWHYDLPPGLELHQLESGPRTAMLLAAAAASTATLILSCGWLFLRTGAGWKDMGWRGRGWSRDATTGVILFLMTAPAIYGLQWCLTRLWPTQHPLVVLLMKEPDERFFLVSLLVAVGVAPVVEEYLYRVVLQGWLEQVGRSQSDPLGIFFGRPHQRSGTSESRRVRSRDVPRWPVAVSSLLFAASHLSHGPDPIPLLLVGLVLGELYRRTHRVLPCIVFHAALNAFSLAALYWSVSR